MEPTRLLFTGTERPITAADIQEVEQEYGLTLPAEYKVHLLVHNGGWPKNRDSYMQPGNESEEPIARTISDFYAVKYGDATLEDALEDLQDQIHPDLVPFGSETGGDQFVLSVGPEDYGSVYYIAHEFYTPPKRKEMKQPRQYGKSGVYFLAPSFTAFLDGLIELPEEGAAA